MKKNIIYTILFLCFMALVSCDDEEGYEEYDVPSVETQEVAGDWFIVGYFDDGTVAYGGDYNLYTTFNTVENNSNFWIDDHNSFFQLKTKVQANLGALTFSGPTDGAELYTEGTVTISNGKIIKDGGRAYGTRAVVDSIYFEAVFDWEPGTTFIFGGHKRSGFLPDESPHIN